MISKRVLFESMLVALIAIGGMLLVPPARTIFALIPADSTLCSVMVT